MGIIISGLKFIATICLIILAMGQQSARANLVTNGGFENGLSGWTNPQVAIYEATYDIAQCGGNASCEAFVTAQLAAALATTWHATNSAPFEGTGAGTCTDICGDPLSQSITTVAGIEARRGRFARG
jgi:hypothetical protein